MTGGSFLGCASVSKYDPSFCHPPTTPSKIVNEFCYISLVTIFMILS